MDTRPVVVSLSAWCLMLASASAGCSTGRYEGVRRDPRTYVILEGSRIVPVAVLEIRRDTTPFAGWGQFLVDICEGGHSLHQSRLQSAPICLRTQTRVASQTLAEAVARELPSHRRLTPLMRAGCYFNRDIGVPRATWIISMSPFAIAFGGKQAPPPGMTDAARAAGLSVTPAPALDIQRYAKLVSEADACLFEVDTVLVYPDNMILHASGGIEPDPTKQPMWADLVTLPEPTKLADVMRALSGGRTRLISMAARSQQVRVSQ